MTDTAFVQFQVPTEDKKLLTQISVQDGNSSMSATLRRLIRQEALRRGLIQSLQGCEPPQLPQPA